MTVFSTFALSFGALLACMAVVAAWLFRTASAPMAVKMVVPLSAVALACYTPFKVNALLGYPAAVTFRELPEKAELVAYIPQDEAGLVDLWLRLDPSLPPRAFETRLTSGMKAALRAASTALMRGRPVALKKTDGSDGRPKGADKFGIGDDDSGYVLDESAMSALPAKAPGF